MDILLAEEMDILTITIMLDIKNLQQMAEALEMVDSRKLNSLIVVQEGKPVGLLHVLDLLRIGAA